MDDFKIVLQKQKGILAVCSLSPEKGIPAWLSFKNTGFISVTQTADELSIVCDQKIVPFEIKAEKNWKIIRIKGQLDFSLVGILNKVITPLSENGISIYTISTYQTDYILIKEEHYEKAMKILEKYFSIEDI